jgi:hypothetical protein
MTSSQRKRKKEYLAILSLMGGRLYGHNDENYRFIADCTMSSVSTVKSWSLTKNSRIIPESKLTLLRRAVGGKNGSKS